MIKMQQEVNVRVAVRVRPLLPKEKVAGEEMCVKIIPSSKQVVLGKDRGFTFDYVFSSKTTQDDVYESCVTSLVRSIFDGYNATIFAYGQTGSGKTYTMGGGNISSMTEDEDGLIPRAIKEMFEIMQNTKNVDYCIKVSYIEIYKEDLQDLLEIETSSKDLHLREDEHGNTVIIGAKEVDCETLDDVMSLLEAGSAVRHTGSTQMNEHSSRSHSIFTIVIGQKWSETDVMAGKRKPSDSTEVIDNEITHCMSGKFHFVDLAGSERAHRTGNVGDRFKESVHINSGLLALGNVISALGDPKKKSTHIPYRESKITRLLKAKNIKNKPIVNRDQQSIRFEEMQTEIKELREELARQRTSVLSNFNGGVGDFLITREQSIQDAEQIKKLEEAVVKLQTECAHYKMIAEEAYKQFIMIQQKDILSQSQDGRLKEWLELMEEIKNKVPSTLTRDQVENETIKDLQVQLKKCKDDLKSDEEIFAEKNKEVNQLMERMEELETLLEERDHEINEAEEKNKKQEQIMLEQQMKIEELQKVIKESLIRESSLIDDEAVTASAPPAPTTGRRPKSVPIHLNRRTDMIYSSLRPPSRNIKTSPALFTLDRVMKSFRARSQLLVSRLEDNDEVLHATFSDEGGSDDVEEKDKAKAPAVGEDGKFVRRGTFRIKKGKKNQEDNKENNADRMNIPEIKISKEAGRYSVSSSAGDVQFHDIVRKSQDTQRQIKDSQLKMTEAHQKMRDLSINIRLKEQLIKELVKTGKEADSMNKQYSTKIKALEKEKEQVKQDLQEMQKMMQDLEAKEQQETVEKQKLQQEYRKKIEASKARMSVLQKKQKETEKIANFSTQNEKKINDLELAVDRMKQQQENLQKKLKDEMERKVKLERDMQKEIQRVKELEKKNEQQQKILKRKNEEIAIAQRKLRSGSLPPINMDDHDKIEDQKKWLDNEVEKDLKRREAIIAKKEAVLAEKSELEIKRLRSSQVLNKSLLSVSTKLESVDKKLEEKSKELSKAPEDIQNEMKEEIHKLKQAREKLQKQKDGLEDKIHNGKLISEQEERRQLELRHSQMLSQSEDNMMNKLNSLTTFETKTLLSKYFEKVIGLRDSHRKLNLRNSEMEVKIDEQARLIRELEGTLQRSACEIDRKLTKQQNEYEQKIQLLMHQIADNGGGSDTNNSSSISNARVQQLERDLYYYKKTSRDLKKKMRELLASGALGQYRGEDLDLHNSVQSSIGEHEPVAPNSHREHNSTSDRASRPLSARSEMQQVSRPSSNRSVTQTSITPVKISRRDLRLMSDVEVSMRRSNASHGVSSPQPQDSLDGEDTGNNPWS
ncbi:hypothetical protein KUTeg_022948 [Tegillarca granosa]|uniref:Kinesin motor domain-containing protein n=1 Tax=Tegillarca granosa TaxID=220873 RepID=A0ABQ9E6H2_TEGGR|nr:hypothetical protein KUTeg_022948 [Tegillarca granosa]